MTSFFNYCVRFYKLEKNVASNVGIFKLKDETKNYNFYTLKEFKIFIKHVEEDVYKQFFNLMFFTGLRPGEAMALRFSDLKGFCLSITKTMDEHGKRLIDTPKTKNSIRNILIDRKLFNDLSKLKNEYIKKYGLIDYDYLIFGGIKPLSSTTINRRKIKACEKANIFSIKLHEFRHSHATLLLDKRIIINEISRRLGHSHVSTTLNIYTHTNLEQEKRVFRTLNSLRFNFISFLKDTIEDTAKFFDKSNIG